MGFVQQPHKCACFGGFCWKNLCPKQQPVTAAAAPKEVRPAPKRRRLKTLRERTRAYSASPTDAQARVWRPDNQ